MSKEQWGHGYYSGYEAGLKGKKEEKYICTFGEDGFINGAYMIIEKHQNKYTVENLDNLMDFLVATGYIYEFSEDLQDVDLENVQEISIDDLNKINKYEEPLFFYSQYGFRGFVERHVREFIRKELAHAD